MFRLSSSGTAAGAPSGGGSAAATNGGRRAKFEELKRRLDAIYLDPSFTSIDLGVDHDDGGGVGDAGIRQLSKIMLDCPKHHLGNLRVLNLSYNRMTDDGSGRDLAMALRQNVTLLKHLQRVNLSHNCLTSSGTTLLMGGLTHLSSLRVVNLSHNRQIDDEGARSVATFLESTASPLQELDLGFNLLSGRGVMAIFYSLGRTRRVASTLRILNLEHNCIDTLESGPLTYALQSNTVLVEINLQQNPSMGMIGTAALVNGLGACPSCPRKLRLAENGLGAVGIRAICPSLAQSASIAYLDLRDNDLGPRGAADIATLLLGPSNPYASRTALRELGLARNDIGSFGLKAIARALVRPAHAAPKRKGTLKNKTTTTTPTATTNGAHKDHDDDEQNGDDSSSNKKKKDEKEHEHHENGGSTGATTTRKTRRANASTQHPYDDPTAGPFTAGNLLTFLDLRKNDVGASGALHLAEALACGGGSACRLSRILLSANRIGDAGASALADALRTNETVTYLGLQDNEITSQGAVALVEALLTTTADNVMEETETEPNHPDDKENGALEPATKKRQKPSPLKCLMLEANQIGNIGARAMAQLILASSPSPVEKETKTATTVLAPPLVALTTLDLRDNAIGIDGAKAIADALRQVGQIRQWSEQHSHLLEEDDDGDGGANKAHLLAEEDGEKSSRAAKSSTKPQDLPALRVLHLCDNVDIGTVGAKAIAKALPKSGMIQLTMNHCGITDRVILPMVRLYCSRNLADKKGTKPPSAVGKKNDTTPRTHVQTHQQQEEAGARRGSSETLKPTNLLGGLFQKRSAGSTKPSGPVSTAPSTSAGSSIPSTSHAPSSTFVPAVTHTQSKSSDARGSPIFPFYAKLMDRDKSRGNVHRKLTELLPLLGDVHQMKIYYTAVATFWRLGAITAEERADYIVEAMDHAAETCRDAASMADLQGVLEKAREDGNLAEDDGQAMEDKYQRFFKTSASRGDGVGHHSEFVKTIGLAAQYNTSHIDSLEENLLALKTAVRNVQEPRRGFLYKSRFETGICFVGTVLNIIASLSSTNDSSSLGAGEPSLLQDVSAEIAVALLGRVVDFGDVTHIRAVADSIHAVEALRALHDGGAAYSLRMNDNGFFAALRESTDALFLLGATNAMLRTEEGHIVSMGHAETPPSSSSSLALHQNNNQHHPHHHHKPTVSGPETDTSTVTESELGTDEQLGEAASVIESGRPSTIVTRTKKAVPDRHDVDGSKVDGTRAGEDDFEDVNDDDDAFGATQDGDDHVGGEETTWDEKEYLEQIKDAAYVEEVDEEDEELDGYVPKTPPRRRSDDDDDKADNADDEQLDESTRTRRRRRIVPCAQEGKEEDPDVGFDTDDEDDFPLHAAIKYGIKEVLQEELESGEDANRLDPKGRSPADFAALRGELNMLRLIQDFGGSFRMGGMAKMQTKAFDKLSSKKDGPSLPAAAQENVTFGDKSEF